MRIEYRKNYMTDDQDLKARPTGGSKEEVALELMRFIATTTGLGKTGGGAGFAGKAPKSPEEQVDALFALYERCKGAVK
jgi:hypothetical protein